LPRKGNRKWLSTTIADKGDHRGGSAKTLREANRSDVSKHRNNPVLKIKIRMITFAALKRQWQKVALKYSGLW